MRMRVYGWLLGQSAFCLLAGTLGLGISFLFTASSLQDDINAGRVGFGAASVLLTYGGLSLLGVLPRVERSHRRWLQFSFFRWTIVAAIMVIPTAVLVGPSGGFHHHIGFGIPLLYMVWNGEDSADGSLQIVQGYEVRFDPLRFGILFVIWIAILVAAVSMSHPTRTREQSMVERTN